MFNNNNLVLLEQFAQPEHWHKDVGARIPVFVGLLNECKITFSNIHMDEFGQYFVARNVLREKVQVGLELGKESGFLGRFAQLELFQEEQGVHKFVLHETTDGSALWDGLI